EAQGLWRSTGKSLPSSCDAPLAQLATRGGLDDGLRWERFDRAVAEGQGGVMRAIARGMGGEAAALANAYATVTAAPNAEVPAGPRNARSRLVASCALARLAKTAPDRAEDLLPGVAQSLGFDADERARVLYPIALWTVASYGPQSARRLAAVPES